MPREIEAALPEKNFVLQSLSVGVRLDGREFEDYRAIQLSFGDEYGVVDLQIGKTRILVKVTAEVTAPYPDRPCDGIFVIATELSPMISPAIEPNRPSETEILLSRLLEKTIRRSGALDTESLCLQAGRKVWSVRADVHVFSHDGNLVDVACLGVVAALRHFRKPDTSVEGEELTVFTPAEREPVPLGWLHSPLCVSFSFFSVVKEGAPHTITVLDATWLEEQVRVGSLTVSLNKHGEICQIFKPGGEPVDAIELLRCSGIALQKARQMSDFMDTKLSEDARRRDKGGLISELLASENDRQVA
jgi:exosome complex component RRP45